MKKALALLLALCMVFALCACGQQAAPAPAAEAPAAEAPAAEAPAAEEPAAPAGEIVINFPSIWVGTDSKAAYMAELVEKFNEENAGAIKVVVEEQTDYQAYRDKIRTTITTGNAPDLCILDTTFDIKAYTESGKFMDLSSYLADGWGDTFTDGIIDAWSYNGVSAILPFESSVFTPIYNTKIFAEIGWDHFPVNYDEFFQFCKDAKAAGYNAMGQMAGENAWSSAEMLNEMYEYTFDGAISAGAADVNGHWTGRDTAIYLNGPWWIANMYKEDYVVDGEVLADVCEAAPNPAYEDGQQGCLVAAVQGFLAAAKQDDPAKEAAVVKFMKYITDPDHVSELALKSGSMFFVKYEPSPETSELAQKVTAVANSASYSIQHAQAALGNAWTTEFPAAVSALVLGEVDAQGFVDQLQTAMDNAA